MKGQRDTNTDTYTNTNTDEILTSNKARAKLSIKGQRRHFLSMLFPLSVMVCKNEMILGKIGKLEQLPNYIHRA